MARTGPDEPGPERQGLTQPFAARRVGPCRNVPREQLQERTHPARNRFRRWSTRTIVMYRPGYAAEGARLAHDLHIRIARPLDGMRPAQLLGAHLVLVMGK